MLDSREEGGSLNKSAILIVDGDETICRQVQALLISHGLAVRVVTDSAALLRSLASRPPRLMVIEPIPEGSRPSPDDPLAPPTNGHRHRARLPSDHPMADHSMPADRLIYGPHMIGDSAPMRAIKSYIGQVAATDSHVLITGETGTGKELAADLIHRNSPRASRPFVWINCAAIPDSLLESELFGYERGAFTGAHARKEGQLKLADGGTVFLDEIGDMTPYAQAKILRAIESKAVYRLGGNRSVSLDVRVIAATNQSLDRLVAEEKFRKDLYFRLNVVRIHLPPLRERKEDIMPLCTHYLRELNQRFQCQVEGFTADAMAALVQHDWPGNVRELKNLLEATFVSAPYRWVSLADLPAVFRQRAHQAGDLPQSERERLLSALLSTNWNLSKAAQQLHWSRMTVYRKLTKYHIVKGEERA
jgi:DNA-binding NtrC family response regulator